MNAQLQFHYITAKEHQRFDGCIKNLQELDALLSNPMVEKNIAGCRAGDKTCKGKLPAIVWQGVPMLTNADKGQRLHKNMVSNRKFLIDLDHIEGSFKSVFDGQDVPITPQFIWQQIHNFSDFEDYKIQLAFVTPSGKGLKLVCEMNDLDVDILECQKRLVSHFHVEKYFDEVNIDYSRLAFVSTADDILYIKEELFTLSEANTARLADSIKNFSPEQAEADEPKKPKEKSESNNRFELNEETLEQYRDVEFRGRKVREIVDEWVVEKGTKAGWMNSNGVVHAGEVHSIHQGLLKDIRNLCGNEPLKMISVIPLWGHELEEVFNQAKFVCNRNSSDYIEKNFFLWLRDKGYLNEPGKVEAEDGEEEGRLQYQDLLDSMPTLPPIIREFVNSAPPKFKIPTIGALLPIIGTLTSYACADYFDGERHTTSFQFVTYAPPGGGKSFCKKFLCLLEILQQRQELIEARERLYDTFTTTKSQNKDGVARPVLQKRILPAKFSEVQLYQQLYDNRGLHLFTFCPEIDTLLRQIRGNGLSDLLRMAYDNDESGQTFRSASTFKGMVRIYWNLIATGTPERIFAFFKQNTDGLNTRITMLPLFDTRFSKFERWKPLKTKDWETIHKIVRQFDANTYEDPVDIFGEEELRSCESLEDFDKKFSWNFKVKERMDRDLSYLHGDLLKWLEVKRKEAVKADNDALYDFSKRSANKGFRAGIVANELWGNKRDKLTMKKVQDFCNWWTEVEQFGTLSVFGAGYNEDQTEIRKELQRRSMQNADIFDMIPETFVYSDVEVARNKTHKATPARNIIHLWIKEGFVKKIEKGKWQKIKKK